jgi:hypothetical protein
MNKKETNKPLTVFLDTIGRTVLGKVEKETDSILSIQNPALVHIQPNPQTNQLQLQILPLFFREFQADKNQPTVWNFRKDSITTSEDVPFSFQFVAQYEQLFSTTESQQSQEKQDSSVVKLFDE